MVEACVEAIGNIAGTRCGASVKPLYAKLRVEPLYTKLRTEPCAEPLYVKLYVEPCVEPRAEPCVRALCKSFV